jgi:hypothetical protein
MSSRRPVYRRSPAGCPSPGFDGSASRPSPVLGGSDCIFTLARAGCSRLAHAHRRCE